MSTIGISSWTGKSLLPQLVSLALTIAAMAMSAEATTYYISPNGSDTNDGLSELTPWKTATKVNNTSFVAGSTILFARDGEWRESLIPKTSGTLEAPIVFGAYGAGAKPKFLGSDVLSNSSFQPVAGTTSTYKLSSTTAINWVYDNHEFMHAAEQCTRPAGMYAANTDAVANRAYVDSHAGSFYYSTTEKALYINTGGDIRTSADTFTGAVRGGLDGGAIYANNKNNLIFRDLVGDETAHWNGGYVFRTMNSTNIRFEDCEAYRGGKHHFGVINTTGFVGTGLLAEYAMPDMWSGAATATVSYSDTNNGRHGNTSQWIDCTVQNYDAMFPAFYMHGGGVGDVLLQNFTALGCGIGSGPEGTTTIRVIGGLIENGEYSTYGSNTLVDGMKFVGPESRIRIWGNNNIVQNIVMDNPLPDENYIGINDKAAILDRGLNNTFRFNTIVLDSDTPSDSAVFCLYNKDPGMDPTKNPYPDIYGNIISGTPYIFKRNYTGNGDMLWDNNLYGWSPLFNVDGTMMTLSDWQALGYDLNSLRGDPLFRDAANGDYSLLSDSDAINRFYLDAGMAPLYDILGNERLAGTLYDMGAYEAVPEPTTLVLLGIGAISLIRRRR